MVSLDKLAPLPRFTMSPTSVAALRRVVRVPARKPEGGPVSQNHDALADQGRAVRHDLGLAHLVVAGAAWSSLALDTTI